MTKTQEYLDYWTDELVPDRCDFRAMLVATKAHQGQRRRGGAAYITHPHRVAIRVKRAGPEAVAVAWLHDVLEDTPTTPADLAEAGIPGEVIEAVKAITKDRTRPYAEYLDQVIANPIAWLVKIADIKDNMDDQPTKDNVTKYEYALQRLYAGMRIENR